MTNIFSEWIQAILGRKNRKHLTLNQKINLLQSRIQWIVIWNFCILKFSRWIFFLRMHLETSSFSMHVSRNSSKAEFILQRFHDHCSVVSDYSRFGSIELTYKFFIDIFSELNEYKSEKTFELIFFFFFWG